MSTGIHSDIKWRHLGVFTVFTSSNQVLLFLGVQVFEHQSPLRDEHTLTYSGVVERTILLFYQSL